MPPLEIKSGNSWQFEGLHVNSDSQNTEMRTGSWSEERGADFSFSLKTCWFNSFMFLQISEAYLSYSALVSFLPIYCTNRPIYLSTPLNSQFNNRLYDLETENSPLLNFRFFPGWFVRVGFTQVTLLNWWVHSHCGNLFPTFDSWPGLKLHNQLFV